MKQNTSHSDKNVVIKKSTLTLGIKRNYTYEILIKLLLRLAKIYDEMLCKTVTIKRTRRCIERAISVFLCIIRIATFFRNYSFITWPAWISIYLYIFVTFPTFLVIYKIKIAINYIYNLYMYMYICIIVHICGNRSYNFLQHYRLLKMIG